jgi:hypothetical protein
MKMESNLIYKWINFKFFTKLTKIKSKKLVTQSNWKFHWIIKNKAKGFFFKWWTKHCCEHYIHIYIPMLCYFHTWCQICINAYVDFVLIFIIGLIHNQQVCTRFISLSYTYLDGTLTHYILIIIIMVIT